MQYFNFKKHPFLAFQVILFFVIIMGFIMAIFWSLGDYSLFGKIGRGSLRFSDFIQRLKSTFIIIPKVILENKEFNPNISDIPTVRLHLKLDKIERLNSNLPRSGTEYENGSLEANGKIYPVKIKYRGDLWYHWGSIQKSWRVKMKDGDSFKNMKVFNIINSKSKAIIDYPLSFNIAKNIGILAPSCFLANFMLNNKFQGVMVVTEQIDKNWMDNIGLEKGDIYAGEGEYSNAYRYFADFSRRIIWTNADSWQKIVSTTENTKDKDKLNEILKFITETNDEDFNKNVWKYFDREMFIKFHAAIILGVGYPDDNHNWKIYINSETGVISPILWDAGIVDLFRNPNMEFAHDFLSARMFSNKEYFIDLAKYVYKISNTPGLKLEDNITMAKNLALSISSSIFADRFKDVPTTYNAPYTNRDWELSVEEKINVLKEWQNDALKRISDIKVFAKIIPLDMEIKNNEKRVCRLDLIVSSFSGITIDTVMLKSSNYKNSLNKLFLIKTNDFNKVYSFEDGIAKVGDELVPERNSVGTTKENIKDVISKGEEKALYDQCGTIPTAFSYYLTSENTSKFDLSDVNITIAVRNIVTGKLLVLDVSSN